jgi:hypothetical protein
MLRECEQRLRSKSSGCRIALMLLYTHLRQQPQRLWMSGNASHTRCCGTSSTILLSSYQLVKSATLTAQMVSRMPLSDPRTKKTTACVSPSAKLIEHPTSRIALIGFVDTGPEEFRDAPLAVQVVGMHQEDDQLMVIAKVVDEALNGSPEPAKL